MFSQQRPLLPPPTGTSPNASSHYWNEKTSNASSTPTNCCTKSPSEMRRITLRQFLAYTTAAHLLTCATHFTRAPKFQPPLSIAGALFPYLVLSTLVLSASQPSLCPRYTSYAAFLITATFYTTAQLVPLLESWALCEAPWSTTQVLATHFAVSWCVLSEAEYWRARLMSPDYARPMYPDFIVPHVPCAEGREWYARVFPGSIRLETNDDDDDSAIDWQYLVFVWTLQVLVFVSLGAAFWCARQVVNPMRSAEYTGIWPMGYDTLFTSRSVCGVIVNFGLARVVRVGHGGLCGWAVEMGSQVVEGWREKRREKGEREMEGRGEV